MEPETQGNQHGQAIQTYSGACFRALSIAYIFTRRRDLTFPQRIGTIAQILHKNRQKSRMTTLEMIEYGVDVKLNFGNMSQA